MNGLQVSNTTELCLAAENEQLFENLIVQVVKDFQLAGIELDIETSQTIEAYTLIRTIEDAVYTVIQRDNVSYLNLLYIVDVPEKAMSQLQSEDIEQFTKDISFLILKRCWVKVWYKAKY